MQYMLVQIFRGTQVNENTMSRPQFWNAEEVHKNSVGSPIRDGGLRRGENVEGELWFVTDTLAARYVSRSPDRISVLSEDEADAWVAQADVLKGVVHETEVSDSARIDLVNTKLLAVQAEAAGLLPQGSAPQVTQEDLDALNPDSEIPGVVRRAKTASEMFTGKKNKKPKRSGGPAGGGHA